MGQLFLPDNFPTPVVASTTTLTLAATNLGAATRIAVGGQQYTLPSQLTLNTATTGANGLDTGALGNIQLWYVYAVVNASTFALALVASQTAPANGPTMPAGYGTAYKLIGAFYTNDTFGIGGMVTISGQAETEWINLSSAYIDFRGVQNAVVWTNTTVQQVRFKRKGDTVYYSAAINFTGTPGGGVGGFTVVIPGYATYVGNRLQADSTKFTLNSDTKGLANAAIGISSYITTMILAYPNFASSGSHAFLFDGSSSVNWNASIPAAWANNSSMTFETYFPVSGWKSTLL